MKNIWSLLSALFFVLSALCLPPVSSLAIPPRRGVRSYSPVSPSPSHVLWNRSRKSRRVSGKRDSALPRQAKSVPILDDIKAYLGREQPKMLPKSPEGQAIAYALSNWEALIRYAEDGDLEIDNNGAERSLRAVAVGRKNWLSFGSDNGGRTAGVLTSFNTTCKRLDIDPVACLRDIFQRLSTHSQSRLAELLPDQWRAARRAASTSESPRFSHSRLSCPANRAMA